MLSNSELQAKFIANIMARYPMKNVSELRHDLSEAMRYGVARNGNRRELTPAEGLAMLQHVNGNVKVKNILSYL